MKRIAVVTDNAVLSKHFLDLFDKLNINATVNIFYSETGKTNNELEELGGKPVLIKNKIDFFIDNFDVIFSIHCKQIFPKKIVESVRCYNLHPGMNPFNRGWYPQVFSILNKKPIGGTIHRMDAAIDHGYIIDQIEVENNIWDTSLTLYNKVIEAEKEILNNNLLNIINDEYTKHYPEEGNYNGISDFNKLLEIDLNKPCTYGEAIDLLRALSHPPYKNAFYIDPETGKKVHIEVKLTHQGNEQ